MRRKKAVRLLAVIGCSVMILGALSACASGDQAAGNGSAQQEVQTDQEDAAKQQEDETQNNKEQTEEIKPVESSEAEGSESEEVEVSEELMSILKHIHAEVEVGTSGSSLQVVNPTAKLMDWGVAAQEEDAVIRNTVQVYMEGLGSDEQAEFSEQLDFVYDTYQTLLENGQEGYLDDAGYTGDSYPWSDSPIQPIETVHQAAQSI